MLYLLALLSGIPALVYEVVWTREVGLVLGGQVEGIALVLAVFFGGLALGAHWLGRLADRTPSPLRLYAALEAAAGLLAPVSLLALRELGSQPALLGLAPGARLVLCGAVLLPVSLPLGGTLPALLRALEGEVARAPRTAGWLLSANTAGAVLGVVLASVAIPLVGLRATLLGAAGAGVALGAIAIAFATERRPRTGDEQAGHEPLSRLPLVAAALAGAATLAFEVLAARMAALQLGSSLLAWSAVLVLFLLGLALGNGVFAARAARTPRPARELGWIETGAAAAVALGLLALAPGAAQPSQGLTAGTLSGVALALLPAAVLMGGAFPFCVRLAVRDPASLGRAFGTVSAFNTAGGMAGSLAAPFLLLPGLGLLGGALACAGTNAVLGVALLLANAETGRVRRASAAAALAVAAALPIVLRREEADGGRLLFVEHGRQASAAVVRTAGRRDLLVDGDLEASTAGAARATEELLALTPLLLHPEPLRLLELGLGSGITLGTATRLPLERIECVEIARSVIAAAPFFAPDNLAPTAGGDPRVRVLQADARAFLVQHRNEYDVAVANTVHPWSLGATGLYSSEYFGRMADSLRPGGVAVQWLPVAARLRALPDDARALLARNGIDGAAAFAARRLADAAAVRQALGPGEILSDDRPTLEARGLFGRGRSGTGSELALLARIALVGGADGSGGDLLRLWLESRALRAGGDVERADGFEAVAADAGFAPARRARAARVRDRAARALAALRYHEAAALYGEALTSWPDPTSRFGLAVVAFEQDDLAGARSALEELVTEWPEYAPAWNLLGDVRRRSGDGAGARAAFDAALDADPFFPEAMANAGLLAVESGDRERAHALLARLRTLEAGQPSAQQQSLAEAVARMN